MPPGQLYRFAWLFYLVLAVGAVVWIGWREGAIPLAIFIDGRRWWLDLAFGVAAGALLLGGWELARQKVVQARDLERQIGRLLGPLQPSEAVALALLSGFAEELFFRGAMQTAWGWLPATLVFTLLHAGPGSSYRIWTAFALVAGLLFAGLMAWRGNITSTVVAHALVNAVNLQRLSRLEAVPGEGESPG